MSIIGGVDCAVAADIFQEESGRIGLEAYRVSLYQHPWLALVRQSEWPTGMGETISRYIPQRTIPASTTNWTAVSISDGSTTGCQATFEELGFASDLKTAALYQKWISSEWFCYTDLIQKWNAGRQIQDYADTLSEHIALTWGDYFREQYQKFADHKVIAEPNFTESSGATFPNTEATYALSMGMLRRWRTRLIRDSAGQKANAWDSKGSPVFHLVSSEETIENLIKDNDDIRQDFRWSKRVGELLGNTGEIQSYGGYNFMVDPFPRRYNFEGGAYVEVERYTTEAATQGTKAEINPAWEDAEFEVSYIVPNDQVIEFLNPNPNLKFGNMTYDAQNFRGEVQFFNQKDATCNPFGDQGRWIARLMTAPSPIHTRWGYAIMHLRCDVPLNAAACAVYSGYNGA